MDIQLLRGMNYEELRLFYIQAQIIKHKYSNDDLALIRAFREVRLAEAAVQQAEENLQEARTALGEIVITQGYVIFDIGTETKSA